MEPLRIQMTVREPTGFLARTIATWAAEPQRTERRNMSGEEAKAGTGKAGAEKRWQDGSWKDENRDDLTLRLV